MSPPFQKGYGFGLRAVKAHRFLLPSFHFFFGREDNFKYTQVTINSMSVFLLYLLKTQTQTANVNENVNRREEEIKIV